MEYKNMDAVFNISTSIFIYICGIQCLNKTTEFTTAIFSASTCENIIILHLADTPLQATCFYIKKLYTTKLRLL
jgi:hypothetical protein